MYENLTRAGKGRPKGSKNKVPLGVREYILAVAERLEKEGKGLYEWTRKSTFNESDFWTKMYRHMAPTDVNAKVDVEGKITIEVVKYED